MNSKLSFYLVCGGFAALVIKSFMPAGLGIAEALMSLGCISYLGFLKYTELKEAVAVKDSYDDRLKSLENKLMFLTSGTLGTVKRR